MSVEQISGLAKPSESLLRRMRQLYGEGSTLSIEAVLDDVTAVEALAQLIEQGFETCVTKDGRLDTKDLAAFLLREIRRNQK